CFFFSSRRRHTRWPRDWSSDVCSSDLAHGHIVGNAAPWIRRLTCSRQEQSPASPPWRIDWTLRGAPRHGSRRTGDHPDDLRVQRSEEHTSELQSRGHLVCRLLLEKKNN